MNSRRLVPLAIALVTLPACKRDPSDNSATSTLASTISTADPRTASQLTSGFYAEDKNPWRWTQKNFSVTLAPPRGSAQKGAQLVLRFTIHETIIQNLKSVTIGATADGLALPPQQFINPGQYTYTRDVPAEHLQRDGVLIEFALDHALPPSAADSRELGVIVNEVGLEVK